MLDLFLKKEYNNIWKSIYCEVLYIIIVKTKKINTIKAYFEFRKI